MEKGIVFNFINKELELLAKEYIDYKLKREIRLIEKSATKLRDAYALEMQLLVEDNSERRYKFKFYFYDTSMDCYASRETENYPIKESSNESIVLMEMFLNTYIEKFGVDYIENFFDSQVRVEIERSTVQKEDVKNMEELLMCERQHKSNLKALDDLRSKMVNKFCNKV